MNEVIRPELSVVVLCYGTGEYARIFSKKVSDILNGRGLDYEIILVGNYIPGRDEITPRVVSEIAAANDRISAITKPIVEPDEGGMGWNMRAGFNATRGRILSVIDGDGQMPAEDLVRVYEKLKRENLDLCKTVRVTRHDGWWRIFISRIFNVLMRILFPGIEPNDINGKPKMFTRASYDKLRLESNDWFIDAEIMIQARRYRLLTGIVETTFYKNPERASFISVKALFEFLKNIALYRIK